MELVLLTGLITDLNSVTTGQSLRLRKKWLFKVNLKRAASLFFLQLSFEGASKHLSRLKVGCRER